MQPSYEQTIEGVEQIYQLITGSEAPPPGEALSPIPPEADPQTYVERRLGELLALISPSLTRPAQVDFTPPLSVTRQGNELWVDVDLPGLTRDAIDIHLDDTLLSVTGVRTQPISSTGNGSLVITREQPTGRFQRTSQLPQGISSESIQARYSDGVLQIRLTVLEEPQRRRAIPIS